MVEDLSRFRLDSTYDWTRQSREYHAAYDYQFDNYSSSNRMSNRKYRKSRREFFLLIENSYFCRDKETNGSVYKGSLVEFVKHELKRVVQIPKTGTFVRSTSYGPYNSYGSEDSSDSDISGHKRRSQAGSGSNQGQRKCIQEILYCNLGKGMDS